MEYVSSTIDTMISEYESKPQAYQTMLASMFLGLLVYLSRQYEQQKVGTQNHIII
ncbi:hypothetical protein [Paenibacillus sp. FSL W7-1287]|uniref:hypothetical protein n=1 Tax=Paenibacillus sp. FSL W7-1287 TaxID=2954538 RepID=UPI0030F72549